MKNATKKQNYTTKPEEVIIQGKISKVRQMDGINGSAFLTKSASIFQFFGQIFAKSFAKNMKLACIFQFSLDIWKGFEKRLHCRMSPIINY